MTTNCPHENFRFCRVLAGKVSSGDHCAERWSHSICPVCPRGRSDLPIGWRILDTNTKFKTEGFIELNDLQQFRQRSELAIGCISIWAEQCLSALQACLGFGVHEDVIKWKPFPRYSPFVRGIHRSPVNSPHKGQWRGALLYFLWSAPEQTVE